MNLPHRSKVVLIQTGKALPFFISLLVMVSYMENTYAMINGNFVFYGGCYVLNKPISHFIGNIFEYDVLIVVVALITSIAVETCMWNKLCILYLALHLVFKHYIQEIELDEYQVYVISTINVVISGFFCYKGIAIWLKNIKIKR